MAVSTYLSGSVSTVLGTVHVVGTLTVAGVYVAKFDLGVMQNGDEVELRFSDTCGAAGTLSVEYGATYAHRQSTQIKASPPVVVTRSAQVMIKSISGTARTFNFDIVTL